MKTPDRDIYTVSRLNREVRALLEGNFLPLWIEGEISNLSRPASGHMYFSLKDEQCQVRCALFRQQQRQVLAAPRDGLQVIVRARVSLYEGRGDFQLIIDRLEEAGEGALRRAFELLRQRLTDEGLFAPERKKPLPRLPNRIGVVTSASGAVLHDILMTLRRRFPAIAVLLYPVPVQGEGAAEKIAQMLSLASARRECDALILARGGGSLEDLQAFNDEMVARAIAACRLPVVTGVGHETDFTIADFVADARAPTPTAAAELLSPDQRDWLAQFMQRESQLIRLLHNRLTERAQRLDWLLTRLIDPKHQLLALRQRLGHLVHRLIAAETTVRHRRNVALYRLRERLLAHSPASTVRLMSADIQHLALRLRVVVLRRQQVLRDHLAHLAATMQALSPLATLARGYAIVRSAETGKILRASTDVQTGDVIEARLAQGVLDCRVEGRHGAD